MQAVIIPLNPGDQGSDVANLQDGLRLFVERHRIELSDRERAEITPRLADERAAQLYGPATRVLVIRFRVTFGLNEVDTVDEATAATMNAVLSQLDDALPFVVRGQIRRRDGTFIQGAWVSAYDRDLRQTEVLGIGRSDEVGQYEIRYGPEQFWRQEKGSADLVVAVLPTPDSPLEDAQATSPILFNAPPEAVVDLALDDGARPPSEYERIAAELAPLLGDVALFELGPSDIAFLAGDTALEAQLITLLAESAKCWHETEVYAEAFYGWFREGLPTDLDSLLTLDFAELRRALLAAIDTNIVPEWLREAQDSIPNQVLGLRAERILRPGADGRASLGDLLRTMPEPLDTEQQHTVARASLDLPAGGDRLAERLAEAGLPHAQVIEVVRTLRLGDVTLGNAPMIAQLQQVVAGGEDASLRALADLGRDRWLDLAFAAGVPPSHGLDIEGYASGIAARVEALHPTPALASRLRDGALIIDRADFADLGAFLANNPNFEIMAAPLDQLPDEVNLDGVHDAEQLTAGLRKLRGLKSLGASWSEVGALVDANLDSPFAVLQLGPNQLSDSLAARVPPTRAQAIYQHAMAAHDAALGLMGAFSPRFSPVEVAAIAAPEHKIAATAQAESPTLRALFGDLDSCACRDCLSVLSPAAYYVDLLELLRANQTPLDTLLQRRPDLIDLEISCANSETRLPMIDLVLEILENAVSLPLTVELSPGVDATAALRTTPLPALITDVLRKTALQIGDALYAEKEQQQLLIGDLTRWTITDGRRRWALDHREESFYAWLGGMPPKIRRLPLAGVDRATLIGELDQSRLPATLVTWIEDQLARVAGEQWPLRLASYGLTTLEAGRRWRLNYRLRARVQATQTGDSGTLTLMTADDQTIFQRRYSAPAIAVTARALSSGTAGGLLRAMLAGASDTIVTAEQGVSIWSLERREETLELRYVPERLTVTALTYQSLDQDADLLASPENRNPDAYSKLRAAVFPWTLPFDLPLAELRAALELARPSRGELIELIEPSTRFSGDAISQETLGISAFAAALITTPAAEPELWSIWGLVVSNGVASIYDASAGAATSGAPLTLLSRVSILMQQARLSFAELQDVLQTRFVAEASQQTVGMLPLDECQPSKLTLQNLIPAHLDRIHRFVRMWRALGWQAYELDVVLAAVRPRTGEPDQTLARLAQIKRLQRQFGLTVEVLASWWADVNTRPYRADTLEGQPTIDPLYDRLFTARAMQSPPDTALMLTGDRSQVAGTAANVTIASKVVPIAAALGVRPQELVQLTAAPNPVATGVLSLAKLSALHRTTSLMRALGVSAEEYQQLLRLTGLDPFASPEQTLLFCEIVEPMRASEFTIAELAYLLRHEQTPGQSIALSPERASQILGEIRRAIQTTRPEDSPADTTKTPQADSAVNAVARILGLALELADGLLRVYLSNPGDTTQRAIHALLDPAFTQSDVQVPPTAGQFPQLFLLVYRLHKIALLCARLRLGTVELKWLAGAGSAANGMTALDLDALPAAASTASLFPGWQQLLALVRLSQRAAGMPVLLTRYVAALRNQDLAAARTALAEGLVLSETELSSAAQQLGITTLDHYRDPLQLQRLVDLLIALRQLGASLAVAKTFVATQPTQAEATAARLLIRARLGSDRWADRWKPATDILREQQRAALVDYLVAHERLRDADQLYVRFLIDAQMDTCFVTTRLLQAISAVQLFTRRCLLGLETAVPAAAIDRTRWEWMQNYRVWEANRKVFLYPENWLFPELRDDKTQIFRELEGALNQSEPSYEAARLTVRTYLDQLNELAQITVLGMYEDRQPAEEGVDRVLFIVGRSPNPPYRYFWRRCTNFGDDRMQWDGWEPVELDVVGDHVLPFVFEGVFHIAWPVIRRLQQDGVPDWWEVQLAWSRHTSRGWEQKKVSRDRVSTSILAGKDERTTFAFQVERQMVPLPLPAAAAPKPPLREQVTIYSYKARERTGASKIIPVQIDTQTLSSPLASVLIDGQAFLQYRNKANPSETVYDYLRDAKVVLDVQPRPGQSYDYWVSDVNTYLHAPLTLYNTDNNGRFWYAATANDGRMTNRFLSVMFVVKVSYQKGEMIETQEQTFTIDDPQQPLCVWHPRFVFDTKEDKSGLSPDDPERLVEMIPFNSFVFTAIDDVKLGGDLLPALPVIADTQSYASSYREVVGRTTNDLRFGDASTPVIFADTPGRFVVTRATAHELGEAISQPNKRPWHYQDLGSSYYLRVEGSGSATRLLVFNDGHAYASTFRQLAAAGLGYLFAPEMQALSDNGAIFQAHRTSSALVQAASLTENEVSFDLRSSYANYNWELFLHIPLLISDYLTKQQRFEDAQQWLHYVFDPTAANATQNASGSWRFLPFRRAGQGEPIQQLLDWLANPGEEHPEEASLRHQIEQWKAHPFRPHAIARLRQRAYQWRVLFAYLDNLIAWGDQLFRQDTRESIDEATLLYVLAANLLGPRPRMIPSRLQAPPMSYRALAGRLDAFNNTWYSLAEHPLIQAWLKFMEWLSEHGIVGPQSHTLQSRLLTSLGTLYFCVPYNAKLDEYWNQVADRLFKIRHCRTIDGVARELPLLAPPIDPALLVRAVAAGVEISSVLEDSHAPLPPYRFGTLLQRATELSSELKTLGGALLAALEKQDAEQLGLIRSGHEIGLLTLVRDVREQQISEAEKSIDALRQSRTVAVERYRHYQRLLGKTDIQTPAEGALVPLELITPRLVPASSLRETERGLGLIQSEQDQLARLSETQIFSALAGSSSAAAGVFFALAAYPPYKFWAEPTGHALNAQAATFNTLSTYSGQWATRDALMAGYERRRDEWSLQSNLAAREIMQLDAQITAASLRLAIAHNELRNHDRQAENASAVDAFLRDKYTNQQLYSWMAGQLAEVYFHTYQLAYDLARRAELSFAHELELDSPGFVKPGYWDTLKSGLLAGEQLTLALKRMDAAYLERHTREYELTRHVSLIQLDPLQFVELKVNGVCEFALPEELFDGDYPGHYFRRIVSVGLSIPCVVGPYVGVNCTLTHLGSSVRTRPDLRQNVYERATDQNGALIADPRFKDYNVTRSIVTSTAQNDSGMFEPTLRDERFLPFEGLGAISRWRIDLPQAQNNFDIKTVSDVILHLRYTAREDRGLHTPAVQHVANWTQKQGTGLRLLSLRHEFPDAWFSWQQPKTPAQSAGLTIQLSRERFPLLPGHPHLTVDRFWLVVHHTPDHQETVASIQVTLNNNASEINSGRMAGDWYASDFKGTEIAPSLNVRADAPGPISVILELKSTTGDIVPAKEIADVLLLCRYR